MMLMSWQPETLERVAIDYEAYQPVSTRFTSPVAVQFTQARARLHAIEHLCEAHDWESAALLIERLLQQQDSEETKGFSLRELQALLRRLPQALAQVRPYLCGCAYRLEPGARKSFLLSLFQRRDDAEALSASQSLPAIPLFLAC